MAQKMSSEAIKATHIAGGKRMAAAHSGINRDKSYSIEEAVKLVKERAKAKFDENDRGSDEPRRRSQARRPDGTRRVQPAQRLGPLRIEGNWRIKDRERNQFALVRIP